MKPLKKNAQIQAEDGDLRSSHRETVYDCENELEFHEEDQSGRFLSDIFNVPTETTLLCDGYTMSVSLCNTGKVADLL